MTDLLGNQEPLRLVLNGVRPVSLNQFYRGMNPHARRRILNEFKWLVMACLNPDQEPYLCRVDICVTAYFDKAPMDADNIGTKAFIDALRGRVIVDDSMKYVRSVTKIPRIDKDNPRVEILIAPVDWSEE